MARRIKHEFARLEARYGRKTTVAILVSMMALAAVPIPGAVLLPLCIAEMRKHVV